MSTVSVIVVTHNSAATIQACLRSIATAFQSLSFEVLLVDTESSDQTLPIVQAEAGALPFTVLRVPNRGFGSAANTGAAQARGDILWFVNPDVSLPPRCGERLFQYITAPRVVAVSGVLTDAPGRISEMFGEPFPSFFWYIRRRFPGRWPLPSPSHDPLPRPISVPWLSAASLLMRADAFRAVGGFSQQYFLYYEDVDLCRRLRMAGGTLLIDPHVRIQHVGGQSTTTAERLRASDMAEDRYFAGYRTPWERALLQMFRPLLRVRGGALLFGTLVGGAVLSVPSLSYPAVALAGMCALWSTVVRAPDFGASLLFSSLLFGQIIRLPIGAAAAFTATDLALPLVVGAWLVRAAHRPRPQRSWITHWSIFLPLLALLPGLLLARERLPLSDWLTALLYAVRLLLLVLLVPLGARVLQRPRWIPLGSVGVAVVLAFIGMIQWHVFPSTTAFQSALAAWLPLRAVSVRGWDPHLGRLFSTWLDPNLLGGMLVLGVAALLTLPLPKRIGTRLAALGGSVALLAALMLTKSRTSLIALFALLAVSVFVARPWRRLSLLVAGVALGLMLTPSFLARVATISRLDPTTGLRVLSWQQAVAQSRRAPIFGLGYNTYGVEQLAVGNIQTAQLHSWAGADSSPLTLLATTGLWGATLFSVLLVAAAWALLRRARGTRNRFGTSSAVAGAAFLSLVSLFVHAQFVQSLLSVHLAVPLALLLAAAFAGGTSPPVRKPLTSRT